MKSLIYFGTFDEELLYKEILAAFPAWRTKFVDGHVVEDYGIRYDDWRLQLDVPDNADETTLNQIIIAHDPNSTLEIDWVTIKAARLEFLTLPEWASFTPQEASDAVNDRVLEGWNKQEVDDWIDANVTTLASAKTALKMIGSELVDLREISKHFARMLMHLRDIIVRRSSG